MRHVPNERPMGRQATGKSGSPGAAGGYGRRRGVLLLVVLSLLVLFALIGVTFVLVAGQHYRSTKMALRHEQYGDDPRRLCDLALAQIVRDTTNTNSVLRGHSLLNDLYGNDGIKILTSGVGSISAAPVGTSEQLIDLTVTLPPAVGVYYAVSTDPRGVPVLVQTNPTPGVPLFLQQIQTPGYYNGCVLTMLDGPAANRSTRIVGWRGSSGGGNYTIRVMAMEGVPLTSLINNPPTALLINGRPFNGTGFGFNPQADPTTEPTLLNATQQITLDDGMTTQVKIPYALLPNPVFADPRRLPTDDTIAPPDSIAVVGGTSVYPLLGGIGGADEDYDAPDAQNMLLAHMPLNPTGIGDIIPSLHRPDTLAYLRISPDYTATNGTKAQELLDRQMSLRPVRSLLNHPDFTGSNPVVPFNPTTGPWDVDNDGDGVKDSVWVDIGLPVQTAPDGRTFKPLAAILVLDQDSRLNVNAHGNVAQANPNYSTPIPQGTSPNLTITDYLYSNTLTPTPVTLPRGSGYGPAEISLLRIFPTATDYQNFLTGSASAGEGRYGELGKTAGPPMSYPYPMPGRTDHSPTPSADDLLGKARCDGLPSNYYGAVLSGYGSPSDVWGRGVMGIDYAGQPIYSFLKQNPVPPATFGSISNSATNQPDPERLNSPYDLNLSRNRIRSAQATPTTNDNPFTAAELERVLRRFDVDAAELPDRLRRLLDPSGTNPNDLARLITTDSFDLPGPGTLMTRDAAARLQNQSGVVPVMTPVSFSLFDLLRSRLIAASGFPQPLSTPDQQTIETRLQGLLAYLPPELIAGVRFDLNRPFGNGEDDDGNGVVDEPTNTEFSPNGEVPSLWSFVFGAGVPTAMDLNHDGMLDANDLYARQQYARQLYLLMMTLMPDADYAWARDGSNALLTPPQQTELTSRRVAQWAINVVDFRDPDSIMTPFEYDANPFNGWIGDGVLGSGDDGDPDRRLVWGCESPELLLTETLAMHDRRVEDKSVGNLMGDMTPDDDYDQVRIPEGSVFFELYCPRNANPSQHVYSADLYNAGRLDLGRMAPAGASGAYPVWRVAITSSALNAATGAANNVSARIIQEPDMANLDPPTALGDCLSTMYSVFNPAHPSGAVTIDRVVWFASQAPTGNPDANRIFYNAAGTPTLLNPGQYAAVGPRQNTYVGLTSGSTLPAQSISLNPGGPSVAYVPANANAPNAAPTTYPAVPIICTSASVPAGWTTPVGVSVSEPLFSGAYYSLPTIVGPDGATVDTYASPLDMPADGSLANANANAPLSSDTLFATGMKQNYKTALLQRLANPLAAYDVVTNPYITVDWQPIDLMVFNGQPPQTADADPDDAFANPATLPLGSRERGDVATNASLWNLLPQQPTTTASVKGATTAVFDYNINQSLGYLNKSMGTPWSPPPDLIGYTGAPNPTNPGASPFHWLTWNNRPYVSNMELLLVPATSAEQLLREFSSIPAAASNPYLAATAGTFQQPCKHLLNFLISADGNDGLAPYFYRLLEYVHVPSHFVGTETLLNPDPATVPPGFRAPFNKVSNYRDPGRVNINTIPGLPGASPTSPVWDAILNGGPGPSWPEIVASRRGDMTPNVTAPNPILPSLFSHPFRSAGGALFNLPGSPALTREVDATLLRPEPAPAPTRPLFESPVAMSTQVYTNPDRNPYFRYQPLTRLSNLLTTRSNVYAIWVTIGYFEVTLQTPDDPHPDGCWLRQELGADSGEVTRHRAFYIYDRTIPVGFEPGHDHNFEDGVLLRRFIE